MPLSEYILLKMLVPNSFHYTQSGFSFDLKNSFAPGTVTGFKLIADATEIPSDKIRFQPEGHPTQSADRISAANPAPLPIGVRVTVLVNYPKKISTLVLWADTKEAGILQFSVLKSTPESRKVHPWKANFRKPVILDLPPLTSALELDPSLLGVFCHSPQSIPAIHSTSLLPPLVAFAADPFADGDHWGKTNFSTGQSVACEEQLHSSHGIQSGVVELVSPRCERTQTLLKGLNANDRLIAGGNVWQAWELSQESARAYALKVEQSQEFRNQEHASKISGVMAKCLVFKDKKDAHARWNQTLLENLHSPIDLVYWQAPLLMDWVNPEDFPPYRWQVIHDRLIQMIDRMDEQLTSFSDHQPVRQAIDFSRMLTSLNCQIRNQQSSLNEMDFAFLLFAIFSACVDRASSLSFATLMDFSNLSYPESTLTSTYRILTEHFREAQQPDRQYSRLLPAASAGTCWSSDRSAGMLTTTSQDGSTIDLTVINPQSNRNVRVVLPLEWKNSIHRLSSTQLTNKGASKRKKDRVLLDLNHFEVPPGSLTHYTFAVEKR